MHSQPHSWHAKGTESPLAFHVHCYRTHISLQFLSTSNRCRFPHTKDTLRTPCHSKGVRPIYASSKGLSGVQDEAFSTCTSCGSDEVVSASRIMQRGSIAVRCSQCGIRFTATAKEALTTTGTPLLDSVEATKEGDVERGPGNTGVKLYISGLSPKIDSAELRRVIEEFGEVIDSRVVTDRVTGRSRGFGFVTVKGKAAATAVIDILGGASTRLGTRLKVREAIE